MRNSRRADIQVCPMMAKRENELTEKAAGFVDAVPVHCDFSLRREYSDS